MTEENPQPERPAPIISRPTRLPTTADLNRSANEVSATAEMLRTQVDQINWALAGGCWCRRTRSMLWLATACTA